MKVTRSEPVLVHAAAAATGADEDEECYYLSNLDQHVAVVMKTVHVFSPSGDMGAASGGDPAAVLMEALRRVLVHYYPFQGSLAVNGGRLAVRNDRRGVPFVAADADCELEDVGDVVLAAAPEAAVQGQLVFDIEDAATLLTVQVTRFRCGGFALGVAMNHCLADGVAAAEFLRSWAETARGAPLSVPPFLDRTVLRARPNAGLYAGQEFAEMEDVSGLAALYSSEPRVRRAFAIDAATLARLKQQAGQGCSTFAALTAFVWRATAHAMRMAPEQRTKLLFAVDCRRRLDPPLPRGFFGNAVVFACCVSAAGDLLAEPLSAAARSVRDAIERTDDAFVRSAIGHVEATRARAPPSMTATTLVTAWNRLGFSAADFGWGEAVRSGPAELPREEVVMFVRDARDSGGIVVLLGLPQSCMQAFQDAVRQL
ncbi:omega-hydroxypalmitate O-feruloyl transferase [Brachypodium distachyon]|uniref:Uncharacterized protein n=1 Tax=Brachypodium distachyon TaxID=15368 RepID=A0A0Q3J732_BRADI|nr:omega-hydroxypalmitate O-feruloyl transferase [Brachypodium distachyon]KQK08388.1 hypothetical protein BRADI_2g41620v3 [Brachypodium distachyon]|eukprot:XP_003569241.1 omega-hydroxypalmitate O-feruloyl transferase [Brachypodium distachyon]